MNRHQKALRTKLDKSAKFASQQIKINEDWTVVRADEMNWELRYKGKFQGFYGRLLDAFKALPHRMLHSDVKNSLADVQRSILAIHTTIDKAISGKD